MNFVTGGSGMLGSYLLHSLAASGHQVCALKRSTTDLTYTKRIFEHLSPDGSALFDKIKWTDGDLADVGHLCHLFRGVDYVYHAAAHVSFAPAERKKTFAVNVVGTQHVVNAALSSGVKKLCYVSSIAALGSTDNDTPVDETTPYKGGENHSYYSRSKYMAELEVWRGVHEGLNAVIVNPSVILGAGNWNTGSPKFFKTIGTRALNYYTRGITGFVDVRDVVRAMTQLVASDVSGERFVLSAQNISYKQLFDAIAKALAVRAPRRYAGPWLSELAWRLAAVGSALSRTTPLITRETARAAHNRHFYSANKIKKQSDFVFTPIDEAIAAIAEIYLR